MEEEKLSLGGYHSGQVKVRSKTYEKKAEEIKALPKKGYIIPTKYAVEDAYTVCLIDEYKLPLYVPHNISSGIYGHYKVKKDMSYQYIGKRYKDDEVYRHCSVPMSTARLICYEAVYRKEGKPAWFEDRNVDSDYILLVLAIVSPKRYDELKREEISILDGQRAAGDIRYNQAVNYITTKHALINQQAHRLIYLSGMREKLSLDIVQAASEVADMCSAFANGEQKDQTIDSLILVRQLEAEARAFKNFSKVNTAREHFKALYSNSNGYTALQKLGVVQEPLALSAPNSRNLALVNAAYDVAATLKKRVVPGYSQPMPRIDNPLVHPASSESSDDDGENSKYMQLSSTVREQITQVKQHIRSKKQLDPKFVIELMGTCWTVHDFTKNLVPNGIYQVTIPVVNRRLLEDFYSSELGNSYLDNKNVKPVLELADFPRLNNLRSSLVELNIGAGPLSRGTADQQDHPEALSSTLQRSNKIAVDPFVQEYEASLPSRIEAAFLNYFPAVVNSERIRTRRMFFNTKEIKLMFTTMIAKALEAHLDAIGASGKLRAELTGATASFCQSKTNDASAMTGICSHYLARAKDGMRDLMAHVGENPGVPKAEINALYMEIDTLLSKDLRGADHIHTYYALIDRLYSTKLNLSGMFGVMKMNEQGSNMSADGKEQMVFDEGGFSYMQQLQGRVNLRELTMPNVIKLISSPEPTQVIESLTELEKLVQIEFESALSQPAIPSFITLSHLVHTAALVTANARVYLAAIQLSKSAGIALEPKKLEDLAKLCQYLVDLGAGQATTAITSKAIAQARKIFDEREANLLAVKVKYDFKRIYKSMQPFFTKGTFGTLAGVCFANPRC